MPMSDNGLAKLVEEAGEVLEVAGKMIQYKSLQMDNVRIHPSGYNLRRKLEDEMGDLQAALAYAQEALDLDRDKIYQRTLKKLSLFRGPYKEDPDPPPEKPGYVYKPPCRTCCTSGYVTGKRSTGYLGGYKWVKETCPSCCGSGFCEDQ